MRIIKNPYLRVVTSILLAALIFNLAAIFSEVLIRITILPEAIEDEYFQLLLLIFSLTFAFIFSKGGLSKYGFNIPQKGFYIKTAFIVLFFEIIWALTLSFVTINGESHFVADFSFIRTVLSVWILASITEEIFTRGFIQGYLQPLRDRGIMVGKLFISIPVIVSAFIFMSMHLFLIIEGIDYNLFIMILLSTFVLGIVAGYFREKTGSLIPAIFAHMCANIFPWGLEPLIDLF